MERTLPLLVQKILPDIKAGKTVLVVAHANSLRGAQRSFSLHRHCRHIVHFSSATYYSLLEIV